METEVPVHSALRRETLTLTGMDCADCAVTLERGLGRLDGVAQVSVSFATAGMVIEYNPAETGRDVIIGRVRELGYGIEEGKPEHGDLPSDGMRGFLRFLAAKRRDTLTVLSGLAILASFLFSVIGIPEIVVRGLYIIAILLGGYYPARSGLAALRTSRTLDINFLMTVAVVGAVIIREWEEAALVIFLFSLGETLESYTMERARNAIRSLMLLSPSEATVQRGGTEVRLPVEKLQVGDVIIVRPGERIPMDGTVVLGVSAVNQSPITGEAMPVEKAAGDVVFAGTINGGGALEIRVTRPAEDNTLARIIHMVEEAQAQKSPAQRFVDIFARYYTPAVVIGAVLIATVPPLLTATSFGTWFYRALVLLVISCPCALVISTPVSIVSAISNAARHGVLVKGGAYLEELATLKVIAFDKTGTLTRGQPSVVDVGCAGREPHCEEENTACCLEVLALAAAVESRSEHPLAQAIVREARHRGLTFTPASDFRALTGQGAEARLDGRRLRIGQRALFDNITPVSPAHADHLTELEQTGKTVVLVADDGQILGHIAVADEARAEARQTVVSLHQSGVARTIMLTGDNERTARAVAGQVGVGEVRSGLLPEDKVGVVEGLLRDYGKVAMVGDGVNDAPALARATVGIAMGGAGTDQALETADVVLMADDLEKLPYVIDLSRRTRRVIKQNIAFSLLIKALFMVLALPGLATLWMAVFADMGASLLVTLNGIRLLQSRPVPAKTT